MAMNNITESVRTQTSGLASATQVYSGSDMSGVVLPHSGTMAAPPWDVVLSLPIIEKPESVDQQRQLTFEQSQLQLGLLGLLNFSLSPDEPAEADMERVLEYDRSSE